MNFINTVMRLGVRGLSIRHEINILGMGFVFYNTPIVYLICLAFFIYGLVAK